MNPNSEKFNSESSNTLYGEIGSIPKLRLQMKQIIIMSERSKKF